LSRIGFVLYLPLSTAITIRSLCSKLMTERELENKKERERSSVRERDRERDW
jgi:hypothetical protein